jgi:hypothetical protein
MKMKYALFFKLIGSLFALALLAAPSLGVAQTTITKVLVVVGGVQYCDTSQACANRIWNLGAGGVALAAGQSLILTQTNLATAQNVPENFDTSDRANPNGPGCSAGNLCAVQISIATATNPSLTLIYDNSSPILGDPLNDFNLDPLGVNHNESAPFQIAGSGTSEFSLMIGYADNEHFDACAGAGGSCFPQTPWPVPGPDIFIGDGARLVEACGATPGHPVAGDGGCYDAGALKITALQQTIVGECPLTQGFWKNHPDAWPVSSLMIGGATYSKAVLITVLQTPPSGGNAVLILGHQLIAALLNLKNGSIPTPQVSAAIADAQALLTGINLQSGFVDVSSTLGQQMVADSAILDSFNSGAFTPVCNGPR